MIYRFYLETYGCSLNIADSDLIIGRLHQMGLERSDDITSSDIIILNSCGVKEPTEDKIISRLETLSQHPVPVVVTGCLPRISLQRVTKAIPNFAAIIGPQSLDSLGSIVLRILQGDSGIMYLDSDTSSKLRYYESPTGTVICTIPICEGCIGACSYCAVRFARTNVRSYTISEIRDVVRRCVHYGFREIRLTAQDIGAFGYDSGESLVDLLQTIAEIDGSHKFRLGMFNPNLILDKIEPVLDVMSSPHFFQFFHVPLQSGSDNVLKEMNRKYSVHEWKLVIGAIRNRFPQATIATDIIVGHPGETDEDFEMTVDVLRETRPSVINISKYGDRPGTPASKSKKKVHTQTKKRRSRQLSLLVDELVREANSFWLGWRGSVIITGKTANNQLKGRTDTYKLVIVEGNSPIGEPIEVTITDTKKTHLVGKITSN